MNNLAIQWHNSEAFNAAKGAKSKKPFIKFSSGRVTLNSGGITLISWKKDEKIAFGQDVKSKRYFVTKGGNGFTPRNCGRNFSYLTFTNKAFCEIMIDYYNEQKKRTASADYQPSDRATFLVVELEEQKGVFELLAI